MSTTTNNNTPATTNVSATNTDNTATTGGSINRLEPNYSNEEYHSDEDLGEDLINYGKYLLSRLTQ